MNKEIGIRVKSRRKELGLTQTELGGLCNLSQQTIQNIESGRNRSTGNMVALASALQVRPEWLADGTEPKEAAISDEDQQLIQEIKSLPPEKKQIIRATMRAMLPPPVLPLTFQAQVDVTGQGTGTGQEAQR